MSGSSKPGSGGRWKPAPRRGSENIARPWGPTTTGSVPSNALNRETPQPTSSQGSTSPESEVGSPVGSPLGSVDPALGSPLLVVLAEAVVGTGSAGHPMDGSSRPSATAGIATGIVGRILGQPSSPPGPGRRGRRPPGHNWRIGDPPP